MTSNKTEGTTGHPEKDGHDKQGVDVLNECFGGPCLSNLIFIYSCSRIEASKLVKVTQKFRSRTYVMESRLTAEILGRIGNKGLRRKPSKELLGSDCAPWSQIWVVERGTLQRGRAGPQFVYALLLLRLTTSLHDSSQVQLQVRLSPLGTGRVSSRSLLMEHFNTLSFSLLLPFVHHYSLMPLIG